MRRPTFTYRTADWGKFSIEYATEEEVLEFANKLREAGAANALTALMPSNPGNANSCLIANALNFGCEITTRKHDSGQYNDPVTGEYAWIMQFPPTLGIDAITAVAEAAGVEAAKWYQGGYYIDLPQHIGNAAHAFDSAQRGWTRRYRLR